MALPFNVGLPDFLGVHVYMSLLQAVVNKDKTFISIFTGYKIKRLPDDRGKNGGGALPPLKF